MYRVPASEGPGHGGDASTDETLRFELMSQPPHSERLFPARCVTGCAPFLLEIRADEAARLLACPLCGGEAQLIPSAYYTGLTGGRFERVAAAIHASCFAPEQAALGADELARSLSGAAPEAIERALRRIPGFEALETFALDMPHDLVPFASLVRTLLEVYANSPRWSRACEDSGVPGPAENLASVIPFPTGSVR